MSNEKSGHKHGDFINGFEYLPKDRRKKILLLSDDLRMSSGVATMSREIVLGTAHHYNYVQVGGAIKHPETGKRIDVSAAINTELGITDSDVIIYPMDGYGTIELIRYLIEQEKIHAILPYTDPRFWSWLFNHEHELRQKLPILFYHVWDDIPFPKYNEMFYESCDWIGCISKQTYNIVKQVWKTFPPRPGQVDYVPHGINSNTFYPISELEPGKIHKVATGKQIRNEKNEEVAELEEKTDLQILNETKRKLFGNDIPKFVVLYVNRNVRRKMTGDVILAFDEFCNRLTPEQAKECALILHTQPIDEAGTNLLAVIEDLDIKHRIIFSDQRIEPRFMNIIFNIADVTVNISSNEGFGLGTAESLMSGTPIIVNVTGGLQDQCGFTKDDKVTLLTVDDYNEEWGSNHDGTYLNHGPWVKPVFPSTISLQGSVPTPYIYDDRCNWQDVASALEEWYEMEKSERENAGKLGREYVMNPEIGMSATEMCKRFMVGIDRTFSEFKPRKRFTLYGVQPRVMN